jgi:hypothetical protein
MELQAARAQLGIGEALDGAVVQRLVRRRAPLRRPHGEAVVLARHEHAAARAFQHRVVRAAMAERELERLEAGREREQLVAEADAEDRHAPEQLADDGHLGFERLGVTRAVREQDAVVAGERVGVDVVREDGHGGACAGEPAQNRPLAPVVDDRDRRCA